MRKYLLLCLAALAWPAQAALKVLACEPEWAALVTELAGERAEVAAATSAWQDPHRIEARPSLIARARRADLVVCTGAGLEIGWLPVLLRESANPRIQPGRPGYFLAADFVALLDKPQRVSRAEGDVHPEGNPHIQTDPRQIARVAEALAQRLARLEPDQAAWYQARHADFTRRWQAAQQRWETRAARLRGVRVVSQHNGFPYLYQWLGLVEVATLEPKPGLEPSVAHLGAVTEALKARPASLIVRAAYQPARPSEWLAERTGLPIAVLPFTVGGSDRASDLFGLFDDTLDRLLAAAR
ncbi:zinc/manganese transport system substrate-binding protein [Sulfuritortus calidifontis]|uniref:Zinc/manganese transport system substrate-binding protein n=1 Tax=Sulfuritortus calidifontis TaxID=1914471 RepID=A0A4R3JTA6_9PROT|nr:zinc ABC transporter substrate-binding protein [Sulfuritortus calidifontis]TCS69465.1 zinc/manganese transport system substrate-binding protein [Sulfuritortus calidifontis]